MNYKEKMIEITEKAFPDDPKLCIYTKFCLGFVKKDIKSYGAIYYPEKIVNGKKLTSYLEINLDGKNFDDLLLSTCLHEHAHNIQTKMTGSTNHNKAFREIQKKLIYAAFDLNYMDPWKLCAYYYFLSNYSESKKVIKMCLEYIKENNVEPIKFIIVNCIKYTPDFPVEMKARSFKYFKETKSWYKFYETNDLKFDIDYEYMLDKLYHVAKIDNIWDIENILIQVNCPHL